MLVFLFMRLVVLRAADGKSAEIRNKRNYYKNLLIENNTFNQHFDSQCLSIDLKKFYTEFLNKEYQKARKS